MFAGSWRLGMSGQLWGCKIWGVTAEKDARSIVLLGFSMGSCILGILLLDLCPCFEGW